MSLRSDCIKKHQNQYDRIRKAYKRGDMKFFERLYRQEELYSAYLEELNRQKETKHKKLISDMQNILNKA
jgi:hypothetical protein